MPQNIGQAYVQIVPSADGISGSIEKVIAPEAESAGTKAGGSIAKGIGGALAGGTAAVAAGITAVTGAIIKGTSDLGAYGDNIDKMSQKMGLSAQSYQEWDAVMQHSGTSMEAMKASMKTLANAAQTNSDAFKDLGISQEQIAKMSQEELFEATITALQNVENETQRTYLAGKTLGKGATELGALLNTSAEDTQAMRDRVRELGGVMSDEAIKNAALFQDNLQDLQTAISGVGRGIMAELLPGMNSLMSGFTSLIAGESGASEAINAGIGQLGTAVEGMVTNIVGIANNILPGFITAITSAIPQLIPLATTLITTLATSIVNVLPMLITTVLPALLQAGLQLVIGLAQALIAAGPQLLAAGQELIAQLVMFFSGTGGSQMLQQGMSIITQFGTGILTSLPIVLANGVQIITNLVNGILQGLPSVILMAGNIITQFVGAILPLLPQLMQTGFELLSNLLQGIITHLPDIILAVTQVFAMFVATCAEHFPEIIQTGFEILTNIITGILDALPDLLFVTIPQIFTDVCNTFAEFDWLQIGKDIMQGIIDGFVSMIGNVVEVARRAGKSILDAIKEFLHIGSPSKVMRDEIGQWIPKGIAVGIEANLDSVNEAMHKAALMTQTAYNAALDVTAPALVAETGNSEVTLEYMLQLMIQYFPNFAKNKGLDEASLYDVINRQLGTAVV